jgi:hypothetical protein
MVTSRALATRARAVTDGTTRPRSSPRFGKLSVRAMSKRFDSFSAFYPVYLRMHDHPVNRRLHVAGNLLGLGAIALAIAERRCWILVLAPVVANAFAWVGHWYFQRNRPGVFHYPLYGMIGSWRMTWDHVVRRR